MQEYEIFKIIQIVLCDLRFSDPEILRFLNNKR